MFGVVSYWGSFVAGVVLLAVSCCGIRGFAPRIWTGETRASRILALAIVTGFAGAGINTLYWQVWGQVAIAEGYASLEQVRLWGGFLDILFKGLPAISILLHLAAWRAMLPEHEQHRWTVLGMAFYPDANGFFARLMNGWR